MAQKPCPTCGHLRPASNFPASSDVCYRHIAAFRKMGHYEALNIIRGGEPKPRHKKTREELDKAERRRRKERAKSFIGIEPRRLVKRGKGKVITEGDNAALLP
jgi:hypothetical protein